MQVLYFHSVAALKLVLPKQIGCVFNVVKLLLQSYEYRMANSLFTDQTRVPTIWITVGQGPTALAVGAGGGCLDIFTLIYPFFPLSPSLWEAVRYRLKYCLKGPLNPKPTNQPKSSKIRCFPSYSPA